MENKIEFFTKNAFTEVCNLADFVGFNFREGLCTLFIKGGKVVVNKREYEFNKADYPIISKCKKVIFPACILSYEPEDISKLVRFRAIYGENNNVIDKLYLKIGDFDSFDKWFSLLCRKRGKKGRYINYSIYKLIVSTHKYTPGDVALEIIYSKDTVKARVYDRQLNNTEVPVKDVSYAFAVKNVLEKKLGKSISKIYALYHGDLRVTRIASFQSQEDVGYIVSG